MNFVAFFFDFVEVSKEGRGALGLLSNVGTFAHHFFDLIVHIHNEAVESLSCCPSVEAVRKIGLIALLRVK